MRTKGYTTGWLSGSPKPFLARRVREPVARRVAGAEDDLRRAAVADRLDPAIFHPTDQSRVNMSFRWNSTSESKACALAPTCRIIVATLRGGASLSPRASEPRQ